MRFPGLVAAAAWLALAAVLVPAHAEKPAAPVVGNAADGDADLLRWRVAQFPISPRRSEGEETKAVLYEEDPAKPHVSRSPVLPYGASSGYLLLAGSNPRSSSRAT